MKNSYPRALYHKDGLTYQKFGKVSRGLILISGILLVVNFIGGKSAILDIANDTR